MTTHVGTLDPASMFSDLKAMSPPPTKRSKPSQITGCRVSSEGDEAFEHGPFSRPAKLELGHRLIALKARG
jgi:hypothetical protein